mmetsp:Transcript_12257/g.15918  ORF Transcript_12257/g.15918 Transcript_12257/m.15918 type:complete len:122 (+) Transcript_12257:197-562(+)
MGNKRIQRLIDLDPESLEPCRLLQRKLLQGKMPSGTVAKLTGRRGWWKSILPINFDSGKDSFPSSQKFSARGSRQPGGESEADRRLQEAVDMTQLDTTLIDLGQEHILELGTSNLAQPLIN